MKMIGLIFIFFIIIALLLFSGCVKQKQTELQNPASAYCEELGGKIEIRTDAEGNQYGVCIKGSKECEEWALYRGECEL